MKTHFSGDYLFVSLDWLIGVERRMSDRHFEDEDSQSPPINGARVALNITLLAVRVSTLQYNAQPF